ncbi:MAG TPA: hypothetical protein VED24_02855 [Candidatus Acidoferrum sp.]|nr:hypothetical protein [Candidatus Acidoferrum sp.]
MAGSLIAIVLEIIVASIIIAPVLWLVGRAVVGKGKASLGHAIWIVVLGVVINAILHSFVHGLLGFLVTLVVWVALIKHFFQTGWGRAIIVGIVAIIVLVIIVIVLAALGLAAFAGMAGLGSLGI